MRLSVQSSALLEVPGARDHSLVSGHSTDEAGMNTPTIPPTPPSRVYYRATSWLVIEDTLTENRTSGYSLVVLPVWMMHFFCLVVPHLGALIVIAFIVGTQLLCASGIIFWPLRFFT